MLLDEPSEGLAPVIVEQMGRVIRELKKEGLAISSSFGAERQLRDEGRRTAPTSSRRVRIRHQCTIDELMADEAMRRTYLTV